ncbi:MAG TPA: tetratricopeptide repeat protein [Terriglobales bacterium]|jgi:pilus assembly protein FimV|nr:tetratricopeptide repeat protein [Terriglobales bacterium]
MAFGFGFNKQKVLSAAEKFVQQGKLQNAITEYEKVLKADAKDLTVANTVGDLYSRLGNQEKAVECFKTVGDAYASQGFTVKAIAMYKKLSKLKSSLDCVLRLAELYTQQGLFNDARAQYLQVAEQFLNNGELEQAVRIFQKTLEMDPENVAMRTKLAEVYVRLGKKNEAWQIFSAAAETLRSKGQLEGAEEILQRMLKLDPGSSYALLLRGRNAFDAGDMAATVECLEKVADLDSNPDGLRTLLQAYVQTGRLTDAGTLAGKLLSVHNDITAVLSYAEALMTAGHFAEALQVYQQHCDRLLAADSGKTIENLHSLIGHLRENSAALESLLELLHKAGDTSHITEVYELLAHAFVQSDQLEKARDYYLKLTQLEPENQLHARNYQQVLGKLGTSSGARLISAEEGAVMVDELEATAPFIDQRYADPVALAVRAALTDAELFISYNMPAKALGPLMSALPQAPRDLRINQRLAALHTRAQRFTEAAVCCRTLESIYHEAGCPDEATRYGELSAKYEERAASTPALSDRAAARVESAVVSEEEQVSEIADAATVPAPAAAAEKSGPFFHAAEVQAETAEFAVEASPSQEIDLSAEWEEGFAEAPAASNKKSDAPSHKPAAGSSEAAVADAVEEIRFYLANGMTEEAQAAFRKLEQLKPDAAKLEALRAELEDARKHAPAAEVVSVEVAENPVQVEEAPATPEPAPAALDAFVSDLESSLGDGFLPQTIAGEFAVKAETEPVMAAATDAQPAPGLDALVSDLESSLGDSFLAEAPVAQAVPVPAKTVPVPEPPAVPAAMAAAAAAAPAASPTFTYQPSTIRPLAPQVPGAVPPSKSDAGAGVDLADMFGELKHELEEETTSAEEDPETHYNLGVAFREMGLLDEAIGELQKVCQSVEHGNPFPQIMQTYTWLAQCFLDKGVPEAAIRWYEKALTLPTLDADTRTALHYELASSYEVAGNKTAALSHFMEVYGSNIDYRDVAERIKTLKS